MKPLFSCIFTASLFFLLLSSTSSAATIAQYTDVDSNSPINRHVFHRASDGEFSDDFLFDFAPGVTSASGMNYELAVVGDGGLTSFLRFDYLQASLYDTSTNTKIAGTANLKDGPFMFDINESIIDHDFKLTLEGLANGIWGGEYKVSISAVPLPAAAWLFISAFLAIGGWSVLKRKRERKSAIDSNALLV